MNLPRIKSVGAIEFGASHVYALIAGIVGCKAGPVYAVIMVLILVIFGLYRAYRTKKG